MKKLLVLIGVSLFAYFFIDNALHGGSDSSSSDNGGLDSSRNQNALNR
ncbi:hypothetical protein BH23BAC1_BH23BAC1_43430 [soil metagenome]